MTSFLTFSITCCLQFWWDESCCHKRFLCSLVLKRGFSQFIFLIKYLGYTFYLPISDWEASANNSLAVQSTDTDETKGSIINEIKDLHPSITVNNFNIISLTIILMINEFDVILLKHSDSLNHQKIFNPIFIVIIYISSFSRYKTRQLEYLLFILIDIKCKK